MCALLGACASLPGREQRPAISVAQAERNFAADGSRRTVQEAFITAFAADAIMFRPTPVNAQQSLKERPIPPQALLLWTPTMTETAAAGDYAVSTGPSQRGTRGQEPSGSGYFLSVWRANGNKWEVVFDAGTSGPIPLPVAQASATMMTRTLQPSPSRSDDMEQMKGDVLHTERTLIEDYPTLLRNHAAADIRMYRDEQPLTATVGEAVPRAQADADVDWIPQQAFVSRSGDLAYVVGIAKVNGREGGYIRIYRNQQGDWKVAYDLR